MYLDEKGEAQTDLSQYGHLASGVPGTVSGLFTCMKYAKLPFKTLIQPAIDLAEKGFTLTKSEAEKFDRAQEAFRKYNTVTPVFVKKTGWKAGDTLIQKDLANTLKRIQDKGAPGFYDGETAKLIVAEMRRGKGLITLKDLKSYHTKERKPLEFDYKGYTIVSMPPPSSGGVLLMQMLKMVEKRPLKEYGFETVKSVQLMTEAERRAYADRAEHLGDPDFWKVPVKTITSDAYLAKRMADYDSTRASKSTEIKAGLVAESLETTHISIADKWGNVVAVTTTLNGNFGSKTVVGGGGFFLNNEMDDFSIKPGVPNMYGAVGGEANAIAPGKRMLSSMAPTIVLKGKKPFMVVGTPGGTTIPTSVYHTIVDVI
jgi:gamma-glutamyltranspeptidase/glutathione hydrolase